MLVKYTRSGGVPTGEVVEPNDPVAEFTQRLAQRCQQFRSAPVTPVSASALENDLKQMADDLLRQIVEEELNRLEPDDKKDMPSKLRYHKENYRINKKTPARIATRFGTITLRSFLYLNAEDGEPGLHPLHVRLGIGAGSATPALLERVARMSVDHTQAEVRGWLLREHGLKWTNTRLRAALRGFRQALMPLVPALQKARLLLWLQQAQQSRGKYRPVLAAGRDGIMVPMRAGGYQEASTATLSVYDRKRRRLGTIYLGHMPESKQTTLSGQLTALLQGTLRDWHGPLPHLVYVTDKGSAPDDYYRRVLKKMKHPRDAKWILHWQWVLDFWHVCSYIGKMADVLFGPETKPGTKWFAKMRHWLRDRRQGVSNVLRSATQLLDRRRVTKSQQAEFWKAYKYLRNHRRWLDYQGHRRRGIPIGSGVTEAACKTVFTQRCKRSGMRWERDSGQVILDLRVVYLSGIWEEAFAADLACRELPEPSGATWETARKRSHRPAKRVSPGFAA